MASKQPPEESSCGRLPTEILLQIFTLLRESELATQSKEDAHLPTASSGVNRRWRGVACGTPSLWSVITVVTTANRHKWGLRCQNAHIFAQRAESLPLTWTFFFDHVDFNSSALVCDLLGLHLDKIEYLVLDQMPVGLLWLRRDKNANPIRLPRLRHCIVYGRTTLSYPLFSAENLQHITVSGLSDTELPLSLPRLRTIDIRSEATPLDLYSILGRSPELRKCAISIPPSYSSGSRYGLEEAIRSLPQTLPNMTTLCLRWRTGSIDLRVLPEMPHLKHLSLGYRQRSGTQVHQQSEEMVNIFLLLQKVVTSRLRTFHLSLAFADKNYSYADYCQRFLSFLHPMVELLHLSFSVWSPSQRLSRTETQDDSELYQFFSALFALHAQGNVPLPSLLSIAVTTPHKSDPARLSELLLSPAGQRWRSSRTSVPRLDLTIGPLVTNPDLDDDQRRINNVLSATLPPICIDYRIQSDFWKRKMNLGSSSDDVDDENTPLQREQSSKYDDDYLYYRYYNIPTLSPRTY